MLRLGGEGGTHGTGFVAAVTPEHRDEFKVGGELGRHEGFPVVCPVYLLRCIWLASGLGVWLGEVTRCIK